MLDARILAVYVIFRESVFYLRAIESSSRVTLSHKEIQKVIASYGGSSLHKVPHERYHPVV
jgi:hypothetical protein